MVSVIRFLPRHLLAVTLGVVALWGLWTLAYAFLFFLAIVTGSGVGGPLAYPVGMALIAVAGVVAGFGIFMPSCAAGALICRRLRWPKLAAIPLVFLTAGGLTWLWHFAYMELVATGVMPGFWGVMGGYVLCLSLPLGAYWWITEGPGAVIEQIHLWYGKRRNGPATAARLTK